MSRPPPFRGLEPHWRPVKAVLPRKAEQERKSRFARLAKLKELSNGRWWNVAGLEQLAAATTQGESSDAAPAVEEDPLETYVTYSDEKKCARE